METLNIHLMVVIRHFRIRNLSPLSFNVRLHKSLSGMTARSGNCERNSHVNGTLKYTIYIKDELLTGKMDRRVKSERILDHITDTFYIYIYFAWKSDTCNKIWTDPYYFGILKTINVFNIVLRVYRYIHVFVDIFDVHFCSIFLVLSKLWFKFKN